MFVSPLHCKLFLFESQGLAQDQRDNSFSIYTWKGKKVPPGKGSYVSCTIFDYYNQNGLWIYSTLTDFIGKEIEAQSHFNS